MRARIASHIAIVLMAVFSIACPIEQAANSQEVPRDEAEVTRLRDENETLKRQLAQQNEDAKLREDYVVNVTKSLNEVQDSLTQLTQKQTVLLKQSSDLEKQKSVSLSQRSDLMNQLQALRTQLDGNAVALARARNVADASEVRVGTLVKLVDTLQSEIREKISQIASLQASVAKLQIEIERRDDTIEEQRLTIETNNQVIEDQRKSNAELEIEKTLVYYRVGNYRALEQDHVIQRRGGIIGLGSIWVLGPTSAFDLTKFAKRNRYSLPDLEINVPITDVSVISVHPRGSFSVLMRTRKITIVHIIDRKAFWGDSRFLVIAVK